jgi:hypothetical protein
LSDSTLKENTRRKLHTTFIENILTTNVLENSRLKPSGLGHYSGCIENMASLNSSKVKGALNKLLSSDRVN